VTPAPLMLATTPKPCILAKGEIDVWCINVNWFAKQIQRLLQTLAPDERRKAERFHFPKDRHRFIVTRAALRMVLSRYLEMPPAQLQFRCGAFGKPSLMPQFGGDTFRFSVSHSNDLILLALTREREIGIDIEYIREGFAGEDIAESFFSTREAATLRTLPEKLKTKAFFDCWTRKEAYVKARGEGLSFPLKQFDVAFAPGEPASLLHVQNAPAEARRWSLVELSPNAEYAAALAVEGHDCRILLREWADAAEVNQGQPPIGRANVGINGSSQQGNTLAT
jgi:4'-phosphopantetheinyl transferase